MINLKEEYKKIYEDLENSIDVVNQVPYSNELAMVKVELIKQQIIVLKQLSKLR